MTKEIILNNEVNKQYQLINSYINSINEEEYFMVYDWPLMKIAKNNDKEIKELLKNKLFDILKVEDTLEVSEEETLMNTNKKGINTKRRIVKK